MNGLKNPSSETIEDYAKRFDCGQLGINRRPGISERPSLARLFQDYPSNEEFEKVLIKVAALNSLYSTHVRSIHLIPLAQNIIEIKDIDKKIHHGDLQVVNQIASLKISPSEKWYYFSFATKYCFFHKPELYPIYDSKVVGLLKEYNRDKEFYCFQGRPNLRDYPQFVAFISAFRNRHNINADWSKLDKFLWLYAFEREEAKNN